MHKNTFVFVVVLALFATIVVFVNVRAPKPSAVVPTPTPITATPADLPQFITYTNDVCGITLSIPDNHEKLESSTSGAIFINTQNAAESIILTCQQEIPRVPLPPEKIEALTITKSDGSTIAASLYHDATANDGTPIDKLIFTNPDKNIDVYLAGIGNTFQQVIRSLTLL